MPSFSLEVPESVTFEQAIAIAQSLLSQAAAGELSKSEVAAVITKLVQTANGARGFFVTYLTSDTSLSDNPSPAVVQALRANPEEVAELLVKNLAMSAAQALLHHRQQRTEMAQGSERVHQRTARLIELAQIPTVYERSQQLLESAKTGEGNYKTFLERWGYDAEQRQAIQQALQQVLSKRQSGTG